MYFVKYDSFSLPKEDLTGETSRDISKRIFLGYSLPYLTLFE